MTYRHHKSEAPQAFAKPQRKKFLKNDLKRALKQKWSTTSFCKDVHKSTQWLGNKCKTIEKKIHE